MDILPRLGSKNFFSKIVSIAVIQSFILSGISFAAIQGKPSSTKNASTIATADNINIQKDFGLVKSRFSGNSGKLIINIQDAHCNYEAQSNIVNILEGLIANHSLRLVSVEGADGVIDTTWFKAFPDEEVRKEVATYFMKKGEITGPEFLSITKNYPIKLFGAEDRAYYLQNLNAFTSSYPLKGEVEKYYNSIKGALARLKTLIYNDGLKAMDAKSQEYDAKKLQFNDYIRFLQVTAERQKINLRSYENFFRLVSVLIYEKKIDFNVTDKERGSLIDELSRLISKDALTELVSQSIAFKSGKESSTEFYNYLKKLAAENNIDLAKRFPNLYNYIIYNSVYARIDNEKLFGDMKTLERDIKEKLFTNDDQRTIDKLSRHIDILVGMVNIKLLNGDFNYYQAHRDEFSHEAFAAFLKAKATQYGLAYEVDEPTDAVAKSIPKLEDFYAIATKRDRALVENTLAEMTREKQQVAVLVTGGFHSEGMTKLLEGEGVSYVVVCPVITKDVPTPYIQILTNQRTPIEDILISPDVAKKSMLAPFSRVELALMDPAARRAFLASAPARDPAIKNIVRELIGDAAQFDAELHSKLIGVRLGRILSANPKHILLRDIKHLKEAFIMGMRLELKDSLREKAGLKPNEKSADDDKIKREADRIVDGIIKTDEFSKAFEKEFARLVPGTEGLPGSDATPPVNDGGNLIGKVTTDDGCVIDKVLGDLSQDEKTLTLKDMSGRTLASIEIAGKINKQVFGRAVTSIISAVNNPAHTLSNEEKDIVAQIIQFLELKAKEGNVYLIKETANNILGFSDGDKVFIAEFLAQNPIAILHEGGEGYFATNPTALKTLSDERINPHTFLRGLGYKKRAIAGIQPQAPTEVEQMLVRVRNGMGLQDIMFGEDANNDLSRLITLRETIAAWIESYQDKYAAVAGRENREKGYRISLARIGSVRKMYNIISDPILSDEERQILAKIIAYGKASIFKFWEELKETEKRELVEQLKTMEATNAIDEAEKYYQKFIVRGEEGASVEVTEESLDSPKAVDIREGPEDESNRNALTAGRKAFEKGEVAILELAGGSGARLKYFNPKIMFKAGPVMNESLGRLRAQKIYAMARKYGKPVPWLIMTSDVTHDKTVRFFNEHLVDGKCFGEVPQEWVKFVRQRVMPQMTNMGEFILGGTRPESETDEEAKEKARYSIALGGFGHGDARDYILRDKDTIEWLKGFGIKYVMMVNVDNAFLASARSVGFHILSGKNIKRGTEHVSLLVVEKDRPDEKVGMSVLINGKQGLIEYNQIPPSIAYLPYIYVIGHEHFILYRDDGRYVMSSPPDFKQMLSGKGITQPTDIEKWVKEHCLSINQLNQLDLPNDFRFHYLGKDYKKETLLQYAMLWLRLGNINTLIWSLSSFTDAAHPLGILPVVIAKNKELDGYQPETGEYNTKEAGTLKGNKFECMAFHGFLVPGGVMEGANILIGRKGEGGEGGFAPIKEKTGIDTPERATALLSEHDAGFLRNMGWYVSSEARVELSPAFAFLDGNDLPQKISGQGTIGVGSQLFLSGANTTVGKNLNIEAGAQFIVRVDDEYNVDAKIRIGDDVEVSKSASFVINGNGQLIIDNGVVFDKPVSFAINNGELLHIKKRVTSAQRREYITTAAYYITENRVKQGIPGNSKQDWEEAKKQIDEKYPDKEDVVVRVIQPPQDIAPSAGAIRGNGTALKIEEHRGESGKDLEGENSVNKAIRDLIAATDQNGYSENAYAVENDVWLRQAGDAKIKSLKWQDADKFTEGLTRDNFRKLAQGLGSSHVNFPMINTKLVVVKGLKDKLLQVGVAPDLISHPSVSRNASYIDEGDFLYLLSLSNGVKLMLEAILHETAHLNDPYAQEDVIEGRATSKNVRAALLARNNAGGLPAAEEGPRTRFVPSSLKDKLQAAINGDDASYQAIVDMPKEKVRDYFETTLKETMAVLPEDLFGFGKGYDIRGNAQPIEGGVVNLTPANLYLIGKLLGTHHADPGDKALITGDIRSHTPILRYVMALGAASAGVNVDYAPDYLTTGAHNLLSTENTGNYRFMVQVSGSHGVPAKNGFKIKAFLGNKDHQGRMILDPLYAERLADLYNSRDTVRTDVKAGELKEVSGLEKRVIEMLDKTLPPITKDEIVVIDPRAGAAGPIVTGLLIMRGFSIIDADDIAGNEAMVAKIQELWRAGKPGSRRIAVMLNMKPDGKMGRGIWDPSQPEALKATQELITLINANLVEGMPDAIGSVFDGDADRITAILEDGRGVPAFEMTLPYYQRFLVDADNQDVIAAIVQAGGNPIQIVCDVRANSKLLGLVDRINKALQDKTGIRDKNLVEGWFITTGYPPQLGFMQNRMKELDAFVDFRPELKNDGSFMRKFAHFKQTYFTAEASGHNFFHVSESYPDRVCDCAIAGFVTLLNIRETFSSREVSNEKPTSRLTQLFDSFPIAYSSNEVRVPIPNPIKIETATAVGNWMREKYGPELKPYSAPVKEGEYLKQPKDEGFITVAGFKIQLKDGSSALVRWSNTGEELTTIFEGRDRPSLIRIIKEVTERLRQETPKGVDVSNLDKEIKRLEDAEAAQEFPRPGDVTPEKRVVMGISGGEAPGVNNYFAEAARRYAQKGMSVEVVRFGLAGLMADTAQGFADARTWVNQERAGKIDGTGGAFAGTSRVKLSPKDIFKMLWRLKDYAKTLDLIGGNDHLGEAAKIGAMINAITGAENYAAFGEKYKKDFVNAVKGIFGGDVSSQMTEAAFGELKEKLKDMLVIALPKTIDRDTKVYPMGAKTAHNRNEELIIRATHRPFTKEEIAAGKRACSVVQVMGRDDGYLAAAMNDPTCLLLLPEWGQNVTWAQIREAIKERLERYGVATVVVSEGFGVKYDGKTSWPIIEEILQRYNDNPVLQAKYNDMGYDEQGNLLVGKLVLADFIATALAADTELGLRKRPIGDGVGVKNEKNLFLENPAYSIRDTEPDLLDRAVAESAMPIVVEISSNPVLRQEWIKRGGVCVAADASVRTPEDVRQTMKARPLADVTGKIDLRSGVIFKEAELDKMNIVGRSGSATALNNLPPIEEARTEAKPSGFSFTTAEWALDSQAESALDMARQDRPIANICVIVRPSEEEENALIKALIDRKPASGTPAAYVMNRTKDATLYVTSELNDIVTLGELAYEMNKRIAEHNMVHIVISDRFRISKADDLIERLRESNPVCATLIDNAQVVKDRNGEEYYVFGARLGELLTFAFNYFNADNHTKAKPVPIVRSNILGESLNRLPGEDKDAGAPQAAAAEASRVVTEFGQGPVRQTRIERRGSSMLTDGGLTAGEISSQIINPGIEGLEATMATLVPNKEGLIKEGQVVIVWDNDISIADTAHVAQIAEKLIKERLGDAVINVRGNSANILERLDGAVAGKNIRAIVTIGGTRTLNATTASGATIKAELQARNSKILDVQAVNGDNELLSIPVPALYDLALCIGFDRPVADLLARIGVATTEDGKPIDPLAVLTHNIIRIIPRAKPADFAEEAIAQRMAKEALESAL